MQGGSNQTLSETTKADFLIMGLICLVLDCICDIFIVYCTCITHVLKNPKKENVFIYAGFCLFLAARGRLFKINDVVS